MTASSLIATSKLGPSGTLMCAQVLRINLYGEANEPLQVILKCLVAKKVFEVRSSLPSFFKGVLQRLAKNWRLIFGRKESTLGF